MALKQIKKITSSCWFQKFISSKWQSRKILSEIRRFGYTSISDLEDYLTTQFKVQKLNREFLNKHQDDLVNLLLKIQVKSMPTS